MAGFKDTPQLRNKDLLMIETETNPPEPEGGIDAIFVKMFRLGNFVSAKVKGANRGCTTGRQRLSDLFIG